MTSGLLFVWILLWLLPRSSPTPLLVEKIAANSGAGGRIRYIAYSAFMVPDELAADGGPRVPNRFREPRLRIVPHLDGSNLGL